jgi:uncharacterized damage-inducible protein DinB
VERLQDRRGEILKTLDGLNDTALDWKPLPAETNSLAALAVHSLGAERWWLHEIVGGKKVARDREAEFHARAENVTALKAEYANVAVESEQILSQLTGTEMEARRSVRSKTHSVRWCILHVLEHYNEHWGQMQLTRQLWENQKGNK